MEESVQQPCVNCKEKAALEGYPTPLCADCRRHFIKFPIPLWIRVFAGAILVIVAFACFSLPRQLGAEIHMARGEKAEDARKYQTAFKEFRKAETELHDNLELSCHIFICAVYSRHLEVLAHYDSLIGGKSLDNTALANKVSEAQEIAVHFFPSDVLDTLASRYGGDIPDTAYVNAIAASPKDESMPLAYASHLNAEHRYDSCRAVLSGLIEQDGLCIPALDGAVSVEVDLKQPDSAVYYCDRLLTINKEDITALAAKARNLLRQHKDADALGPAMDAYRLDDTSAYTLGTLVLYYYCAKQKDKTEGFLKRMDQSNNPQDSVMVKYVNDVLSGKETFRTP